MKGRGEKVKGRKGDRGVSNARLQRLWMRWKRQSHAMTLVGRVSEARERYDCACDLRDLMQT